jgi:hypothetical protein
MAHVVDFLWAVLCRVDRAQELVAPHSVGTADDAATLGAMAFLLWLRRSGRTIEG